MIVRPLLTIGTRGSPLALVQAEIARAALAAADPQLMAPGAVAVVPILTSGDRIRDRSLAEAGGKGLFTKEIEEALQAGAVDIAVHSAKDMPTLLPPGLVIGAVLAREDPRDAFFASGPAQSLDQLPPGAVIGTASLRRQAQILMRRSDLKVVPLRGNVGTRLDKLAQGQADATLLAVAGLKRLGQTHRIRAILDPALMLPAAGQGALALEIRQGDLRVRALVAAVDHRPSAVCLAAERALLAALDGSCRTPIAALAEWAESTEVRLRALIALPDGSRFHAAEDRAAPADAVALGTEIGRRLAGAAGPEFMRSIR
jgi:hydroxymethylbilane synthase